MTADGFKRLALALPEACVSSHNQHPDFRVGKRVFATLGYPDFTCGMVKLTPAQQAGFMATQPQVFAAANGVWGARGATIVKLRTATRAILGPAMIAAWRNTAPASLAARHSTMKELAV